MSNQICKLRSFSRNLRYNFGEDLKILFCSSEVFPFVKTGGLADISNTLPKELSKLGHKIKIILPKYKQIPEEKFELEKVLEDISVPILDQNANIYLTNLPNTNIMVYLVENDEYYNREVIYGGYSDNLERFEFFSLVILELIKNREMDVDIVHCNDWQTSFIPIYLKLKNNRGTFYRDIKSLLTIHNLGYQGIFEKAKYPKLGLDWKYFTSKYLEFYDKINILKGGIVFADSLNTVSEQYSEEIQTPEFGHGLDGVLRERSNDLHGIINGIDYSIWNPSTDEYIWKNYNIDTLENKKYNKKKLQDKYDLPESHHPLIGIVSRLVSQKGIDLVIQSIEILKELDLQLVVVGTGSREYEKKLSEASDKYSNKISVTIEFNPKSAHQIEAGADIFLMPSQYEPCGLNQMISLKYGTIPIVRETGGLADTIKDIDEHKDGNGFSFKKYDALEMIKTIIRAINTYKKEDKWKKLIISAMKYDFSFQKSARKYEKLYYNILQ
ncbi:MAG: glycogen synthase GlgA [Candidatus Lokiarchaeota archaeon]|nr:glycogen synthase GlgA [Candidatus Lokiarchaeota archaeon]MBD3228312.1 glycogen synthase GlgA [Candidatus Lokiarchaeota archaeon]